MRTFDHSLPMALLRARESIMEYFRPLLKALKLTEQQWRIIRVLYEQHDMEFHELARITCILPPSLSGMLTRLERARLLKRSKPATDQRRLHVALTREGTERFTQMSEQMELAYCEIEAQFGKRRLATLFELLQSARQLQSGGPHTAKESMR